MTVSDEVLRRNPRENAALSYNAGMLRPLTLPGGLSLGDRYCRPWPSGRAFRL
jgi:hypothetical protein